MPIEPDEPTTWIDELDADDPLFVAGAAVDDEPPPDEGVSVVDMLLSIVDATTERVLDRPVRPRMKLTPAGMLRGEIDVLKIEIPAFLASGLVLDRFVVRAERIRITPGLPPHLRAGPVTLTGIVDQDNVDRWTHHARLPFRLQLADEGVVVSTGLAGIRIGEMAVDLDVAGSFLKLRPRRATMLGLPAPLVRFLRGYLPLPPLPRGARLHEVKPADGELTVTLVIDDVDEPMTPQIAQRVARVLRIPLPSLPLR